jgi:SAM-dependent methyltransferase
VRPEIPVPLPLEGGSFDLIWAISVFTHITDEWSAWLLELHRLLREDGLLIATFHDEPMADLLFPEPWDEDRVGMNVLDYGNPWEEGGPNVLHSRWWIEEHWGRAFEIVSLRGGGFPTGSDHATAGQGLAVMRKRAVEVSAEELERIDPGEPREIEALRHNLRQLHTERQRRMEQITSSRSWRLTRPLRWAAGLARSAPKRFTWRRRVG